MDEKILLEEMRKVYNEFGIDIHSVTSQSQINNLVKEIIRLRKKINGLKSKKK